ncbi:MAG: helix-turn-helix transcriptional regulator [Christensenellaceae bacterium]|jgi:DNA-binding PadR family transcriptional regulator|nr:helix-turn-helix transcriptional regulator [Christensenellaceae bacterium]
MPTKEELLSGFIQELRRGTILLPVLSKLQRPAYGYELIADLARGGVRIEANTLYPLLRRLEGQGLLEASWSLDAAKPRKYYAATLLGLELLRDMKAHWQRAVLSLQTILEEDLPHDQP